MPGEVVPIDSPKRRTNNRRTNARKKRSETRRSESAQPSLAPTPNKRRLESPPEERPPSKHQQIFLDHLDFIQRRVAYLGRIHALSTSDTEDLASWIHFRIIQNDFAILRKFEHRSQLKTYLTVVIQNLYRDFHIQRWGKWRPSAAAKQLGKAAMALEALLYRDSLTLKEAIPILRERTDCPLSDDELEEVASRLPARLKHRLCTDLPLDEQPSEQGGAEIPLLEQDRESRRAGACQALHRALAELGEEDRLILRMLFEDGLSIAAIAGALGLKQRPLYRRRARILKQIRRQLEEQGIDGSDLSDLF